MSSLAGLLNEIGTSEELEAAFARLAWKVVCSAEINERGEDAALTLAQPPLSLPHLLAQMKEANSRFSLRILDSATQIDTSALERGLEAFLRTSLRALAASAAAETVLSLDEEPDAEDTHLGIFGRPSHVHDHAYLGVDSSKGALVASCRVDAANALARVCRGEPSVFAVNLYAALLTEVAQIAESPSGDDPDGTRVERVRKANAREAATR